MSEINVRCIMCGKHYSILPDHKDYKKVSTATTNPAFICELCNNKVRLESDDKKRNPKPI